MKLPKFAPLFLQPNEATIAISIGKPIEAAGKDPRALNDEVRVAIEAGLARIAAL